MEYKPGARYTGAQTRRTRPANTETEGYHQAMDPLTGKLKWQIKLDDHVTQAGMLATEKMILPLECTPTYQPW